MQRRRDLAFTSKGLLSAVALIALIFGVYAALGPLSAASACAVVGIVFICAGHRTGRSLARILGRVVVAIGVPWLIYELVMVFLLGIGPVASPARWPRPIAQIASLDGNDLSGVQVECLDHFSSHRYVWSQPLSARALTGFQRDFQVEEIEKTEMPRWFWDQFPGWWCIERVQRGRYFQGGDEDEDYCAVYDPAEARLYVHFYFDAN